MKKICGFIIIGMLLINSGLFADEAPHMKISLIEGLSSNCLLKRKTGEEWQEAKIKDILIEGDQIKTLGSVRAELISSSGHVIRLNANSRFEVKNLQDEKKGVSDKVKMFLGKSWLKIKKISSLRTSFELETPSAVAGVYGTTYRVDVPEDQSTSVKVYSGEVKVGSLPYEVPGPTEIKGEEPHEVQGPVELKDAGPREVTKEEWSVLVTAQQEITISFDNKERSQGKFDLGEDEKDEWVQWNKKRDAELDWE